MNGNNIYSAGTTQCLLCILLGVSPASDCCMPTFRNPLSVPSSRAGCRVWEASGGRSIYIAGLRFAGAILHTITRPHSDTRLLYLPLHTSPTLNRPLPDAPSPIGPASSSKPRPGYKYHVFRSLPTLHTLHPALEDGTDRGLRNVGKQQ